MMAVAFDSVGVDDVLSIRAIDINIVRSLFDALLCYLNYANSVWLITCDSGTIQYTELQLVCN